MIKKRAKFYELDSLLTLLTVPYLLIVVPLGLEPRLFCTKNRRVASYTMGHLVGKFNFIFFTYQIYFQGVCQFLYKTLVLIFVRYGLKIQSACFYFLFSHDLIP